MKTNQVAPIINKYMKQIKTIVMTLIVIGTGLATSCKKYDEGGTHWRTKAKITDKIWKFDYASAPDTSFAIMDSWKTIQFEKNGDWVVNGNKWGTHNFTKAHENEKEHNLFVYVDSSNIYYDDFALLANNIRIGQVSKESVPTIQFVINIDKLKKKDLCLKLSSSKLNVEHKIYYYAE